MISDNKLITIIGCGPAGNEYLIPLACDSIYNANVIIGSRRLLSLYNDNKKISFEITSDIPLLLKKIEEFLIQKLKISVLVTGDSGIASLASPIIKKFGTQICQCIPGISSIQLACSKLCIDWTEALIINAHKAVPSIASNMIVSKNLIIILCGNSKAWEWVLSTSKQLELTHIGYLCSDLGFQTEAINSISLHALDHLPAGGGNSIIIWQREEFSK